MPPLVTGANACLFLVLLCALIGGEVVEDGREGFDRAVTLAVTGQANPPVTRAMRLITELGSTAVAAPLTLLVVARLWCRRQGRAAAAVAVAWIGGQVLGALLKVAFQRPRPDLSPYLETASGYSFPSAHTTTTVVTYGLLAALVAWRLRGGMRLVPPLVAAGLVAAVGFSRIYLGVHYPTDVLGGIFVGGAWLLAALLALRHLGNLGPDPARNPRGQAAGEAGGEAARAAPSVRRLPRAARLRGGAWT